MVVVVVVLFFLFRALNSPTGERYLRQQTQGHSCPLPTGTKNPATAPDAQANTIPTRPTANRSVAPPGLLAGVERVS